MLWLSLSLALADPRVVNAPLRVVNKNASSIYEKRGVTSLPLYNADHYYVLDLGLGSPPQSVEWLMDTSSGDFWVLDPSAAVCATKGCHNGNTFNASKSSTFVSNHTSFYQLYSDKTTANGTWAQDTLSFGDSKLHNFNFAVANISNTNIIVGGIGLGVTESPYLLEEYNKPYANFPIQLKQQGLIAYTAYSLFLNDMVAPEGNVLFGGVNLKYLEGSLYRFPLVPTSAIARDVDNFSIMLNSLYLINRDGTRSRFADSALAVTFDSSTSLSRLPTEMLAPMLNALDAHVVDGAMVVKCQDLRKGGGIGLVFSGIEFNFSFRDIVVPVDSHHCVPGFLAGEPPVIGNNLLRSLYVVYDLEQMELGLGRVNSADSVSAQSDHIVELSTGIPGLLAPGYNDTDRDPSFTTYAVQFNEPQTLLTTTPNPVASVIPYGTATEIVQGSHRHQAPSIFNETLHNGGTGANGRQGRPLNWLVLALFSLV